MSQAQIEKKVEDYLRNSQALEDYWQRPITPEQLQAEMDRMAQHTKQPEVLRELFDALGNDPFVIAECLARPVLAERLVPIASADDQAQALRREAVRKPKHRRSLTTVAAIGQANYTLPAIAGPSGTAPTIPGLPTSTTNAPVPESYTRQCGPAAK